MKYFALTLDAKGVPEQRMGFATSGMTLKAFDTLLDLVTDPDWNAEGNKDLRQIVFKLQPDGSLKPFRYTYGSAIPGAGTWYHLDEADEEAHYTYGINLTDEQRAKIDAHIERQQARYDAWEQQRRDEADRWLRDNP